MSQRTWTIFCTRRRSRVERFAASAEPWRHLAAVLGDTSRTCCRPKKQPRFSHGSATDDRGCDPRRTRPQLACPVISYSRRSPSLLAGHSPQQPRIPKPPRARHERLLGQPCRFLKNSSSSTSPARSAEAVKCSVRRTRSLSGSFVREPGRGALTCARVRATSSRYTSTSHAYAPVSRR